MAQREREQLSDREQQILRIVVDSFIRTGSPVGSRTLARQYPIGLSPASIRNTMSDLEEMGLLDHPHTSAGRVPTESGYRLYVDDLMGIPHLPPEDQEILVTEMNRLAREGDEVWREGSRLLGQLSNLLGVVLTPKLSTGVFKRLDVVPLSSTRAMFVISIVSGLVKTIVLEVDFELGTTALDRVVSMLNERLSGLTLEEIRKTLVERVRGLPDDQSGLVGVVMKNVDILFDEVAEARRLTYSGTQNILTQPEFQEPAEVMRMIDLLERKDIIVHLIERPATESDDGDGVSVRIGAENEEQEAARYSIVTAEYRIGQASGSIGVIGPTRMDYARMIALVEQMGRLLSGNPDLNAAGYLYNP